MTDAIRNWDNRPHFWLIVLAVVMSVGGVSALWLSRHVSEWWEGLLGNIGVTFLGVLLTVFLVERLIERRDQARWAPLSQQANLRLRTIATNLIRSIERHHPDHEQDPEFFIPAWAFRADQRNHLWRLYDNPRWIAYIQNRVLGDAVAVLEQMPPSALDSLDDWLGITDRALREVIMLYGQVLSPDQLDGIVELIDLMPGERNLIANYKARLFNFPRPLVERYLELALALLAASPAKVPEDWRPQLAEPTTRID